MPMNAAVAPSSNTRTQAENLEALQQLVLRDSPWYEALSLTHDQATAILGEDATEYAAGHASQLARRVAELALSSADVDVLKPVCMAFKVLFDAVRGVTANREALVDLIGHSIFVVKTVQPGTRSTQLSPGVRYALDSFIGEVTQVVNFADKFGGQAKPVGRLKRLRRRMLRLIHHADDAAIIEKHAAKLKNIVDTLTAGAAVQSAQDAANIIEDVSELKDTTVDGLRDVLGGLRDGLREIRSDNLLVGLLVSGLVAVVGWALRSAIIDVAAIKWHPVHTIEKVARTLEEHSATLQVGTFLLAVVVALVANVTWGQRSIKGALRSLRPLPVPESASVPITAMRLPPTFIERPSIAAEAVAKLTGSRNAVHALVGIGGCGKSSLASSIVARPGILRHFRDGVFWVSVGRGGNHQLHALLQGLAREVGAALGDWNAVMPRHFKDMDDVIGHLASFTNGRSCLLVLDNVWEAEVVRAARRTGLSLLVTTRHQSTVDDVGGTTTTFVGDMTTEEASAVLLALRGTVGLPSNETLDAIGQVARDCGYLPLALAIVGCLPRLRGHGSDSAVWRKIHDDLMADKSGMQRAKGGAGESLGRVLDASFDALSSKKQEELLRMAVLAKGVAASEDMLLTLWENEDLEETRDEARGLVSRSLLQVFAEGYRLHDLLLDFVRDSISSTSLRKAIALQTRFLGRLSAVVACMTPGFTPQWSLYSLIALWGALEQVSDDGDLCVRTYDHCLLELEAKEASEEVRLSVQCVGNLFREKGSLDAAEPKLRRNLSMSRHLYSPRDIQTWNAMQELADLLSDKKTLHSHQEAETLYRECLQLCQAMPGGSESSSTASAYNGLGTILSKRNEAGHVIKSNNEHSESKRIFASHEGFGIAGPSVLRPGIPEYPHEGMETAVEGEQLLRASVKLKESMYGFMSTGTERLNLAFNLNRQGRLAEAAEESKVAVKILETTCGQDHPVVTQALNNYAMILRHQMKHEEAAALLERCVDTGLRVLGSDHFDVAMWMENLANIYMEPSKQGSRDERLERAEALLRKSLKIRESTFGSDSQLTMKTRASLAGTIIMRGKYEEGDDLLASVNLQDAEAIVKPASLSPLSNAGEILRRQGKFPQAEKVLRTLLRHQSGDATTVHNLARLLAQQGKLDEAERMQLLAIKLCEKGPPPDVDASGLDKAKMLRGMGIIKLGQGKLVAAKSLFEQALTMREESANAPESSLAESLVDVTKVLVAMFTEAAALCSRALVIVEDYLGGHHPQVAATLSVSAEIQRAQGDPAGARSLFENAVTIYERSLDANHPDLAGCRHRLGTLLIELGMQNEAVPLLERAYSARVAVFGESNDESASSFTQMENARSTVENKPETSSTAPRHGQEGLKERPQGQEGASPST